MDPIENVEQAKQALIRVLDFLQLQERQSKRSKAGAAPLVTLPAVATTVGRTLDILRQAGRPLTAKELEAEWQRRGLEAPKNGTLYDSLHGTLLHLAKRGHVTRVSRGLYTVAATART